MEGFCPNCGSELSDSSNACPECGSCEETGWSDRARYDAMGVDYDPEEFDYDQFVENEFGNAEKSRNSRQILWALVALILAFIFLLSYF